MSEERFYGLDVTPQREVIVEATPLPDGSISLEVVVLSLNPQVGKVNYKT